MKTKWPDGRDWYTDRGLLLRARLGDPDGGVLADRVHNAICETCRMLMSRGIVGAFETWKEGVPYACMRGDIETTAGLTVKEPDRERSHSLAAGSGGGQASGLQQVRRQEQ